MSRFLLVGADGQLGSDLLKLAGDREVTALNHRDLDITDRDAVSRTLESLHPDVILNAAAYVDVEACETHRDLAFAVNADGVRNLAGSGARLVHVSTDYVFDGEARAPYTEDSRPNPINVYGASKLAGERYGSLVVRSAGLYGVAATRAKGNFVRTMLRLGRERGEVSVVSDQVLTPTNTGDLAGLLWRMVDRGAAGLYHATNAGECSWFDFAKAIFDIAGLKVTVTPIDSATLGYRARRPAYSVLSNARLERDGFTPLRPWREALAAHLAALAPLT